MKLSKKFWFNVKTKESKSKLTADEKKQPNWEHWDSKAEYSFYYDYLLNSVDSLAKLLPNKRLSVVRQYRTLLATSLLVGRITWEIDFMILSNGNPIIPIEYKGDWVLNRGGSLQEFKQKIAMLEIHRHPSFVNKLVIVGSQKIAFSLKNVTVIRPVDINSTLKKLIKEGEL